MPDSTLFMPQPDMLRPDANAPSYLLVERSVERVIRATLRIYCNYFGTIIAIFAIPIVPFQLLARWAEHEGQTDLYILALLPTILAGPFAAGALTITVADICLGRTPSVGNSYRRSIKKLWAQLLATNLLSCFVVVLGVAALVLPGFLFFTWFLVAPSVVVLEEIWGWPALQRSKALVKGYFWHTLGIFVGLIMLLLILGICFALAAVLLSVPVLSFKFGLAALEVAAQALIVLGTVLTYYDLRVRKEAYDSQTLTSDLMH